MDFHHRNILKRGDQPVAVIDWEGSMPGDRLFDLVTLGFCAGVAETESSDLDAGEAPRGPHRHRRLCQPHGPSAPGLDNPVPR